MKDCIGRHLIIEGLGINGKCPNLCALNWNQRGRQFKPSAVLGVLLSMLLFCVQPSSADNLTGAPLPNGVSTPTPTSTLAEIQRVMDNLNVAEQAGDEKRLFEKLTLSDRSSTHEAQAVLRWLKERFVAGRGGARYAYLYAYNLFRLDNGNPPQIELAKETAAMVLLTGMLTIRADAARCADQSAPAGKIARWEQMYAPILTYYRRLPKERRELLFLSAMQGEGSNFRDKDNWLCSGGLNYFTEYFSKHTGSQESLKLPNSIGETIILRDDSIQPKFISDKDWQAARHSVVSRIKDQTIYGWVGDPRVDIETLLKSGGLQPATVVIQGPATVVIQGKELVPRHLQADGTVEMTLAPGAFTLLVPNVSEATAVQICASTNTDILNYTEKYRDLGEAPCFGVGTGMAMKYGPPSAGLPLVVTKGDGHNYYNVDRRVNGIRSSVIYISDVEIAGKYDGSFDARKIFLIVVVDANANGKLEPDETQRWVIHIAT